MAAIHDFNERLALSESTELDAFWAQAYRRAFPDMVSMASVPGPNVAQRMGIDRVLVLSNGRVLRIDEKVREEVYSDILLEYVSNDKTNTPGWMEKPLAIDYLGYAFLPTKRVYFFDWYMLRRAWNYYAPMWKREYPTIEAQNTSYKTLSVAVPINVVQAAIRTAGIIDLSK